MPLTMRPTGLGSGIEIEASWEVESLFAPEERRQHASRFVHPQIGSEFEKPFVLYFCIAGGAPLGHCPKGTDQNRSDEMTSGAQFNFANATASQRSLMKS
jgi:hypothetical protein